ncbi:MAG: M28 family peptidase [Anaerovoracaceae bacterium]
MNKKKILCLVTVFLMILMTFSACGQKEDSPEALNQEVNSDFSMSQDVKSYLEKVDTEYAYKLTETLAYDKKYWDNDLGWRTSGSDAEHKTADYLAKEMKSIGLKDVEKVGTKVDKFQFNDSKFTIKGTKIDLMPASYQCNGTDKKGITADIIDCKTGFEADYNGKNVKGKIVLVKVDQMNEAWIDSYIKQAAEKGAAALVTYADSGYGELNKDTINVQDICCEDLIPTVAISANQAKEIQDAIKAGNAKSTLMVDATMEVGKGTTYNVVGKIKGKSSDQQIMIAGHYDKYWYGFQDDSAAIALDFAVAKAMIDSGYVPENDITVVAHGAEEWGASNTQFDWTTGAWGMIHKEHPEWAGKTIAMFNCELPAFTTKGNTLNIVSVPEFRTLANKMVKDSGLIVTAKDVKINDKTVDATNMEDGVSYRWHGVPYMINGFEDENFISQRYHTTSDDKETWDENVMKANMNWYGAMAIYIDKSPALELDLTATCDDLEKNLDENIAKEAGANVDAYKGAIADLRTAAQGYNEKIADVNERYEKAIKDKAADGDIEKIRAEGKALNKTTLKAFKCIQDEFLKADDVAVYIGHPSVNNNVNVLKGVITGLEKKELYNKDETSGALDQAYNLNAVHDYNYYNFSVKVSNNISHMYDPSKEKNNTRTNWGTDKLVPVYYVGETTYKLVQQANAEDKNIDYAGAAKVYKKALKQALGDVKSYTATEIKGMEKVAKILK